MADKHIWEIESASTMRDEDRLLIVVGTSEFLINKSDFKKSLGGLSSVDTTKLSKIIIDGDGSRVLANNGEYISLNDLYEDKHNHNNKTILDKFTVDSETGKLFYDGTIIGSDYELPIATSDTLGGVKVDGNTITINENGVISGSSDYELPVASDTVLGGVKIDNDTIKINEGIISADVVGNWASGVHYPIGYFVVYDQVWYECIVANSDVEWTESNWLPIGSATGIAINNWQPNTKYKLDSLVINGTIIYQCNTEHTSGETFDNTNWTTMTGEKGDNGITPHIDEVTKHWMVGETDTNIVAEGKDGTSPTATVEKTDTGATITVISGERTTVAELTNGVTPEIDEDTKHWIVDGEDTGVIAEGVTTVTTTAVVLTGTLVEDGWVGDTVPYTQTVTINGIAESSRPYLYISYSADDADTILEEQKQWGYITRAVTSDNTIMFYCYKKKPTIALNFEAEVR